MAHLSSSLTLAGCLLLGAPAMASPSEAPSDTSLESRLRAEVEENTAAPAVKAPSSRRMLPKLRDAQRPTPVPLEAQRDASAGVRI